LFQWEVVTIQFTGLHLIYIDFSNLLLVVMLLLGLEHLEHLEHPGLLVHPELLVHLVPVALQAPPVPVAQLKYRICSQN
jgi:hypothetical protein